MQWKEDNRDDFDKFWEGAFQDEHVSPPPGLWEDIESEVEEINTKKNHFTFFKSVAAIITVSLLTSFLMINDGPKSKTIAYQAPNQLVNTAAIVPGSLFEADATKELNTIAVKQIHKVKDIAKSSSSSIFFEKTKKEKLVIDKIERASINNDIDENEYQLNELGLVKVSKAILQKEKKDKTFYFGGQVGMVSYNPNIKREGKLISENTISPSFGINAGVQFEKGVFVESGINYSEYDFKSGITELGKVNQKIVAIPVKVGYAIEKKKVKLSLYSALVTNLIVDQKSTDNLSDSILDKSVYLSGQLGAELSYKLSPKSSITLGTSYGVSLTDQSSDNQISAKANAYTVSMGLKYNII